MSKLCFPTEILNQHLVMLGKTGAGKSSALRHVVEHLLGEKKRVCVIDPKGDWWGLKASADGKGAGFPVILFGDFKNPDVSDVPINRHSGKHIAELITSGNRPCVIGMRGWMPGDMTDFWIDFASTLFNSNTGELFVVGDEFHNFAPKGKILDPKAGKVLHWSNRLLSEGRGLGLVFLIASQRPQKVHNDTLTCCETLVAMRVNHTADRGAVKDWIDGCGDAAQGKELLANVAQMARGEAYIWSPEIKFGPERVKFPMFSTFDSFAPPQLQKKVSSKGWSEVDLDAVKEKLAAVIEESKSNDPRELKKRIGELERQVSEKAKPVESSIDEGFVLNAVAEAIQQNNAEHSERVGKIVESVQLLMTQIIETAKKLGEIDIPKVNHKPIAVYVQPPASALQARRAPARTGNGTPQPPRNSARGSSSPINLPIGEQAVLVAAAQYSNSGGVDRDQLSVLTGYKRSSRDAYIQRLREKGFIEVSGQTVTITPDGIDALGDDFSPLPTGKALQEYWRQRLPEGERKVLDILVAYKGNTVMREFIDEATGYKRSSRDAYIQRLSSRRLVENVGRGEVKASEVLFG